MLGDTRREIEALEKLAPKTLGPTFAYRERDLGYAYESVGRSAKAEELLRYHFSHPERDGRYSERLAAALLSEVLIKEGKTKEASAIIEKLDQFSNADQDYAPPEYSQLEKEIRLKTWNFLEKSDESAAWRVVEVPKRATISPVASSAPPATRTAKNRLLTSCKS
jgi:hypothetical protein